MHRAIMVKPNMRGSVCLLQKPLFESVGNLIGGYIYVVRPKGLFRPYVMVVDEEAHIKKLRVNIVGSKLFGGRASPMFGKRIRGPIVILKECTTDKGIELTGMTATETRDMLKSLRVLGVEVE